MLSAAVTTTATGGRGGAITFGITSGSGSATVDPATGMIHAISAGTVNLTASAAGDSDYTAASTTQQITIGQNSQTLTITSANTMHVDGMLSAAVTTTATGGRGGAITFGITSGSGSATVDPATGMIHAISAGTVNLTASAAGDSDYTAASTTQLITIGQNSQTLTITSANTMNIALTATVSTTATGGRGGIITFSISAGSGFATVNPTTGLIMAISPGTISLTASSTGDSDYFSASTTQLITIVQVSQTLTITSANMMHVDGTLTATVTTTATGGRGGSITFAITAGSGSATVDMNTGLITAISSGTVNLIASAAGDSSYFASSTTQLITIGQNSQTLTITSANAMHVDGTLTATVVTTATGGRGGMITFSIAEVSGSAIVNPNTGLITAISADTLSLTVSAAGDSDYYAASATQLITIGKSTPTLTITSANVMPVFGSLTATVSTTATYDRGGAIEFAIIGGSGSATVDATTGLITTLQMGTVILIATSLGDADYNMSSTSQLITISKNSPTLTITSSNEMVVDDFLTVTVNTTATNGGTLTYHLTNGTGLAFVNPAGVITAIEAGTITITVNSAANSQYNAATVSQLITINKATPTLTITSPNTIPLFGSLTAAVSTTATYRRGGAISFAVIGGSGSATVNATTGFITALQAGTITLTATSLGDVDYNMASTSQLITISKGTPTLAITSADVMIVDGSLTVSLSTTAVGVKFSYSIGNGDTGSAAVNSAGVVRAIQAGTVLLRVTSIANTNYYASAMVTQTITISKTTPTLTITSANTLNVGSALTASISTSATYGRGGDLVFAVSAGSGSATVNPNTGLLRGISGGTITLTATLMGDLDYNPATASRLITIVSGMSTQTLSIISANTMHVDGTLAASVTSTATNGGPIIYSIVSASGIAAVNSNTGFITAIQVGVVTLVASTIGNVSYAPASTTQVITIGKGTPTLAVTSANTMVMNTSLMATVHTTATFGRGGLIAYSIAAGSGSATVNPSTGLITAIGAGTVTLIVTSAGDVNYNSASVSQLITITTVLFATKGDFSKDVFAGDGSGADQRMLASKALSPNGDGLNDTFIIQHIENYPNNEVVIANKNGEAVFKAQGYNNDRIVFAGVSTNGAELLDGIYYYTIVFYDQGKMNRLVGYFKLRR